MKNVINVDSNSKSEDTKYNNKPSNYTLELESKISPEPSQDTVSIEDIMHATPKGREAVMKAIENSIEVQNKMTKKAQNTLKESNNLNTSEEHIKDTSLDFIGCCGGGLARHEVCSHVKAYIKAQQAKLLQVIEDEAFSAMEPCEPDCDEVRHARHEGSWGTYQRFLESIKQIKERL